MDMDEIGPRVTQTTKEAGPARRQDGAPGPVASVRCTLLLDRHLTASATYLDLVESC